MSLSRSLSHEVARSASPRPATSAASRLNAASDGDPGSALYTLAEIVQDAWLSRASARRAAAWLAAHPPA